MKKTLALVLALAMVFSTITVAFAEETLGADAQICADLGMLKGETGTVDAAYVATAPTRLQAAVMFLRLKGLEAEALAFTGEENFADGNIAWEEGANLLAYLKANPQLGWVGDGVSFNPSAPITAKEYYKVLLETLGYKQTTAEVVGDFTWENVIEFAATVGLSKVADVANFTVNDLAVATVEALKVNVKDTEKTLLATLVEAGKITEEAAVATGLMEGAAQGGTLSAEIDDVYAIGNAVVQIEFDEAVDAAAAGNIANYSIEGLAINAVTFVPAARANDEDRVILDTAAQTAGKLYTMTVGDKTVQFSGLAKLSDGPEIETDDPDQDGVESVDVEEVVINFDRNIDYATGTDVANYSISGITIVKAEVDRDEVTLTTEGLKDGEEYTVKCMNLKSVDLVSRKTTSEDFDVDYDTTAPKLRSTDPSDSTQETPYADTNTRVIVYFDEEVDEATAEDVANYSIKINETDGAALEILSVEWDSDDEDNVEITTEAMDDSEEYKITVSGIADQCKVPNVMTKSTSKTFDGVDEDEDEPTLADVQVLSPTKFMVTFNDDSRLDAASVLDKSNYDFECDDTALDIEDITEYDSGTGYFKAIFTVEEMDTDESCELTYVDILDEYGNAMDEDTETFTADTEAFTSAKLDRVEATGENTLMVYFVQKDKDGNRYPDVDEASAENIANYFIDCGIGIPTDADYDIDTPYQVELTVNDLIGNYGYCFTIDGLKDIAGNELDVVERDFSADVDTWSDPAELDDADATSRYVVELSFDSEVDFDDDAYVVLSPEVGDNVKLYAGRSTDDDTAIEFASFTGVAPAAAGGNAVLEEGVTYTVSEVYGVTNYDGTAIAKIDDDITFKGTDDEPDYVEFESYEQVDAKTIKLVMSDYVRVAEGIRETAADVNDIDHDGKTAEMLEWGVVKATNGAEFTVTVDSSDFIDETVFFQLVGDEKDQLVEDEEYTFNLNEILVDELNIPVGDDDDVETGDTKADGDYLVPNEGTTTFEGDNEDDDAPSIDDVVARDRWYIEVTFDENIITDDDAINEGGFELWNNDLDEEVDIEAIYADDTFNTNVLVIETSDALEGRYEYELRMDEDALVDYAGYGVADDTFTFDGSFLAEHE